MKNILVVDDREPDLYMLQVLLEGHGYSVVPATNGEEALNAARESQPDLIISDIMMPVMDGFRLCSEWMADERLQNIPFIFYSATYTEAKDEELALSLGAVRFIVKPTEPDEFMEIIQGMVRDLDEGKIEVRTPTARTDKETLKLYDERLIHKLEQKALELEKEVAERKLAEKELRRIEWLFGKKTPPGAAKEETEPYAPTYGDLTKINTERLILDSVGESVLSDIVGDYLDLLDTSAAVYEKNGDYALGVFSSGWCRSLDQSSRELCAVEDNKEALRCGKWLCHESCWTDASRISMEEDRPVDIECDGGIRLYAVPIHAGEEVVGSINFGYGDPPTDEQKLQELAKQYNMSKEELRKLAEEYLARPPFIVNIAKKRLLVSARLIGEIIVRNQAEEELEKSYGHLEELVKERTAELEEKNRDLEQYNELFIEREFRIKELKDRIKELEAKESPKAGDA